MDLAKRQIRTLVADTIGLKTEEISPDVWERVLRERIALSGAADMRAYYQLLLVSPDELQEVVERLIVPETWFFRDKAAFEQMVRDLHKPKRRFTRLLSIPCATGEEPYSMAMALLTNAISPETFRIDAIDISKMALVKAEKGFYSSHSFRGGHLDFRTRYFDEEKGGFQLKKEVRKLVHFSYGNIYHPSFAEGKTPYDLIFCRNLLIYLHPEAQKRALVACGKLLTAEGRLYVAPAEASIAKKHGFEVEHAGRAFLLKKAEKKSVVPPVVKYAEAPLEPETLGLSEAKARADRGEFVEAESLCRHYLEVQIMDPEGYFLLGAIRHARGDEKEAESAFLKTVYLEPQHQEALTYLALLAEKRGETARANQFRRRIKGRSE